MNIFLNPILNKCQSKSRALLTLTALTFIFFLEILRVFSKFTALKINITCPLLVLCFGNDVIMDVRQKQRAVIPEGEPPKQIFKDW